MSDEPDRRAWVSADDFTATWRDAIDESTQAQTWNDHAENLTPKENPVPTPSKLLAQIAPWIVRTLVPLIAAWLLSWAPSWLGLTDDQLAIGVTLAVTYAVALVVRLLEVYVDSRFGVLLGWAKPAVYPVKTDGTQVTP